jgi:ABC-type multidrug transport system permease subunit
MMSKFSEYFVSHICSMVKTGKINEEKMSNKISNYILYKTLLAVFMIFVAIIVVDWKINMINKIVLHMLILSIFLMIAGAIIALIPKNRK